MRKNMCGALRICVTLCIYLIIIDEFGFSSICEIFNPHVISVSILE